MEGLDDLARILFPGNKNQQRVFLAVFVELKWAPEQFLPALDFLAQKHGFSPRILETVRAKMRRLGMIDHVSRFNKKHGYREGWVFSRRYIRSLRILAELTVKYEEFVTTAQKQRDFDQFRYI